LRLHESGGQALRDRLALWADSIGSATGAAWPELPEGVADRRAEAWEPLIAVADAAGGDWPQRARAAAVADVAAYRGRAPSLGLGLLADLRNLFGNRDAITTDEILKSLNALEDAPWGDLKGKPLDARGLAMRLKVYGVKSKDVRQENKVLKGYNRRDLWDVWERYLPSHPIGSATCATCATCKLGTTPNVSCQCGEQES
jgi:hypothetical protein